MIILMAGLPKSGKSVAANILSEKLGIEYTGIEKYQILLEPNEIAEISKTESMIASWELCLEDMEDFTGDCLVVDTCCASDISKSIDKAKEHGHEIFVIFVNRRKSECANHIDKEILNKYVGKFDAWLPKLNKLADRFVIVNNNESIDNLENILLKRLKHGQKGRIHKSEV